MRDVMAGSAIARPWSTVLVAVLFFAAVALVSPLSTPQDWVGHLPSTVNAMESAVAWLPSAVCCFAAWISGQPRAHGFAEWAEASPRSRSRRILPALLLGGLAALTAQVLAGLILGGVSLRFGLLDALIAPDLLIVIPTLAAYLLFWVAVGAGLGRALWRPIALPAAVLLPYALYACLSLYFEDSPLGALAIGDSRIFDYVRPTFGVVLLRALFWIALALAAWAWTLGLVRFGRIGSWSASVIGALAIFQGVNYVAMPGAYLTVCEGTRPILCLDGAHKTVMDRYRQAADPVWRSIPQALRPSVIASDQDIVPAGQDRVILAPPVAGYTAPARIVDKQKFAAAVGDSLFVGGCEGDLARQPAAIPLVLWWRIKHDIPLEEPAFIGDAVYPDLDPAYEQHYEEALAFGRVAPAAQETWFAQHAEEVFACDAPALPGQE